MNSVRSGSCDPDGNDNPNGIQNPKTPNGIQISDDPNQCASFKACETRDHSMEDAFKNCKSHSFFCHL